MPPGTRETLLLEPEDLRGCYSVRYLEHVSARPAIAIVWHGLCPTGALPLASPWSPWSLVVTLAASHTCRETGCEERDGTVQRKKYSRTSITDLVQ